MADNALNKIYENLIGDKPTDTLGDIIHAARNDFNWNPIPAIKSAFGGPNLMQEAQQEKEAAQYKQEQANTGKPENVSTKVPTDAAGQTPEEYTEDPGAKLPDNEQGPLAPTLTDSEYRSLIQEADRGNTMAQALIKEYKPKYGPTATQFEQSLVSPFVKQLQSLPGELGPLEQQNAALFNAPGVGEGAAASLAESYTGKPVVAANATTQALENEYATDTANAQAALKPEEQGLQDLAGAAKLSEKTFPYQALVSDLLNRYAYQVESPSYEPVAANYPGLPDWLKNLFTGATGVQIGGGSTTSNLGVPDVTGISTPSLQPVTPASTPSSTAYG